VQPTSAFPKKGLAALEDAIKDEPDWAGNLRVVPIELDEQDVSPN
jgi:hypothetical protein